MTNIFTSFSQICSGLLPMLYSTERNPDWKVFLNIVFRFFAQLRSNRTWQDIQTKRERVLESMRLLDNTYQILINEHRIYVR